MDVAAQVVRHGVLQMWPCVINEARYVAVGVMRGRNVYENTHTHTQREHD